MRLLVIPLLWFGRITGPGNDEIYLRKSADGGTVFGNATNLSNTPGSSQAPQIASFGNTTFVVWQDNGPGNDEIYLRKSADGGTVFGNATNLSNTPGSSQAPQIASFGNTTFVVWQDNGPGNDEINLRKSNNFGNTFRQQEKSESEYRRITGASDCVFW